ncbi:MAG: hypothetical protein EOO43_02730 [Flavobacterium sp.]|nr:MAG: hypothetical protein EOO43_02730 [Flavobacterium sp.]
MQNFKKSSYSSILLLICSLLILLWVYTAISKLANFAEFERQLNNQTFGKAFTTYLLWLIPVTEIAAALLLFFNRTRLYGLVLSALLMALFTGYISLVLLGYYDRVPCSCGGVLKQLGWSAHLWFNLFFLLLSVLGIYWMLINKNVERDKLIK